MSAAAAIPLADPAFIQNVGGEQNPITSDGLEAAERKSALRGSQSSWKNSTGKRVARMLNNLTFSRHAHPSERRGFAGGAISGQDHQLPLPIGGGAVEITGLARDVDIVI